MRNTSLKIIAVLCITTFLMSCGSTSENKEEKTDNVEQAPAKKKAEDDSNLLKGSAVLRIGDKSFEPKKFLKNKTEVTFTNENIGVRFTLPENDKFITITFTGPNIYEPAPQSFNLTASKGQSTAIVIFQGFVNEEADMDNLMLNSGELTLERLDEETLDFKVTFKGAGQHRVIGGGQSGTDEIGDVSGTIEIQFDNKVDVRKKN